MSGQGRLWRSGSHWDSERAIRPLEPALYVDDAWQTLPGGPLSHAVDGALVFDRNDQPIALVKQGTELRAVRHRNGAWEPVQGTDRPGGINNSPCTEPYYPRLAIAGDLLCVSWLEPTDGPFELFMRCTTLADF